MYSSLVSAGLAQLWESDSPQASPVHVAFASSSSRTTSATQVAVPAPLLKSFLSFDDQHTIAPTTTRKQQRRRRPSTEQKFISDAASTLIDNEDDDEEYRVFVQRAGSPSPSRYVCFISLLIAFANLPFFASNVTRVGTQL